MVRDSKRWSDGNEGSFDLDADYHQDYFARFLVKIHFVADNLQDFCRSG
jgi:hypothetical protein